METDFKVNHMFVGFNKEDVYNNRAQKYNFGIRYWLDVNFQNGKYVLHFTENMFEEDGFICDYIYEIKGDDKLLVGANEIAPRKKWKSTKIYSFLIDRLIKAKEKMIKNYESEQPIVFEL